MGKLVLSARVLLPVILLLLASPLAIAQDSADTENLRQALRLVRWGGVVTSVFVILAAWFVLRFLEKSVDRLGQRFTVQRMTFHKIGTLLRFLVYIATGVSVLLLSIRLDGRVLAVVGGTMAVAVGFALKDVAASVISGITLLVDRPFQVGDRVAFGGQYGDIVTIGLRSVRMRTLDDSIVTIPNNKFLNEVVVCGNFGALDMMVVTDFLVGMDQDIQRAMEIVTEAALTSRFVYLPKNVNVSVQTLIEGSYPSVRLRLKAYVLDTQYERAFQTDVTLRVMAAFRGEGIMPPAILHRNVTPTGSEA